MQRVTLTIPVGTHVPGDEFYVLGNVDSVGRATEACAGRITGTAAVPYWPLQAAVNGKWGQGAWGKTPWGGVPSKTPADLSVATPGLYFGAYNFRVATVDAIGNENLGGELSAVTINSGPEPVTDLRRIATTDGSVRFAFTPPPQFG